MLKPSYVVAHLNPILLDINERFGDSGVNAPKCTYYSIPGIPNYSSFAVSRFFENGQRTMPTTGMSYYFTVSENIVGASTFVNKGFLAVTIEGDRYISESRLPSMFSGVSMVTFDGLNDRNSGIHSAWPKDQVDCCNAMLAGEEIGERFPRSVHVNPNSLKWSPVETITRKLFDKFVYLYEQNKGTLKKY